MVDLLTSIFIITVLYEHAASFGLPISYFLTPAGDSLAIFIAVGGFIFLSGYKITASKRNLPVTDFVKNRLIRLYPPYFLALVLHNFFIQPGFGLKHFILHSFFLDMVFYQAAGGPFLTLYFISLLFIFYAIFLLTRGFLGSIKNFVLINLVIFLLALTLHTIHPLGKGLFEDRFFLYYPLFVFGSILAAHKERMENSHIFNLGIWLGAMIIIWILCFNKVLPILGLSNQINPSYYIVAPIYLLFLGSVIFSKREIIPSVNKIVVFISYSSFNVYLFHHPIWLVISSIFNTFFSNSSSTAHWLVINGLGTVIILFTSHRMQYLFDRLTHRRERIL